MEKERKNKTNVLTGSAGEYFVAAELSRRGVVAALTMSGTDAFDILAVNKAGCSYSIQVKTTQYEKKLRWLLSSKDENPKADFYVFVNLNGTEKQPDYYIMRATPKRDGTAHKPINMRQIILDQQDKSKDRWYLITGETQNGKE